MSVFPAMSTTSSMHQRAHNALKDNTQQEITQRIAAIVLMDVKTALITLRTIKLPAVIAHRIMDI